MNSPSRWPDEPGTYLLLLTLVGSLHIDVGALGRCRFRAGHYAYAGSALGPGGIAARLNRHLRSTKRTRWHIDYLVHAAPITAVGTAYGSDRRECMWATALAALPGAEVPVLGFGSSDCSGCSAHLVRLPDELPFSWIEDELTQCPMQAI